MIRVGSFAVAFTLVACSASTGPEIDTDGGAPDAGFDAGEDAGMVGDSGVDAQDDAGKAKKDAGGGPINCAGLAGTLVMDIAYTDPYAVGYSYNMSPYTCNCSGVGFPAKGALVVRFTTPAITMPPTSGVANIAFVEFEGPPAARSGSLSTTPCDFTTGITGQAGLSSVFAGDVGPTIYFTIGYKKSGCLELQPSTTYYLNAENYYMGTATCSNPSVCDVKVVLTAQPGT